MTTQHHSVDPAQQLTQYRASLLRRANNVLNADSEIPLPERYDALPQVSALLATSLEELKVAEEELVEQNEELIATRASLEADLRYYAQLFDLAPCALLISDVYGSIQ